MERKIDSYLKQWKEKKKKKALMVTGAGQTGKTYSIRRFGEGNYEVFIEINFRTDKKAAAVFENVSVAYALIANLTAYTEVSLKSGNTLIFLDEIQYCPKAREAVRLLVKDGRYDCIEAGMLTDVMDYEESYVMRPLDQEEFLYANGIKSDAIEYVQDCYEQKWPVSKSAHEMLKRIFGYYVVTGGMPEAVQTFIDTHDMEKVAKVHEKIMERIRQDIKQAVNISGKDKMKMNKILDLIPVELNKANKRFMLADIRKSARMERYENSLNMLEGMGITNPCYNVKDPGFPLDKSEKRNLFKLYLLDSGLLCSLYPENIKPDIVQGKFGKGSDSILENTFARILEADGFSLRYFNEKNKGDVSFIIQKGEQVIPIEVKPGTDIKSHAALDYVLNDEKFGLKEGIVFCDSNVEKDGNIYYLPWYMAMFLKG